METSQINIRRVNRFNVSLIWIFSFLLTVQAFAVTGTSRGLMVLATTAGAGLVASAIILFKLNNKVASIIIPLCPALSGTILAIVEGGTLGIFLIYLVACCMAALYFNRISLIIYIAILDMIFVICNFIFGKPLMGHTIAAKEAVVQLGMINIGLIVLYFLTKWGNDYFSSSSSNEKKAMDFLGELKKTFIMVEHSAVTLNNNLVGFMRYIDSALQNSEAVTKGMHEMAKGTEEEANAITSISIMMKEAQEKLQHTYEQSKAVESISRDVSSIAQENGREIVTMKESMRTINSAVEQGLQTVSELGESMDHIRNFLYSITRIAEQTNLLALNAAIEAARAGEAGKGFAVVADEIRKLSDESNKTANEISLIVAALQQKATTAVETARNGNTAAIEGSNGLEKLNRSIENMVSSFGGMQNYIQSEFKSVDEIAGLFHNIESHLENNAAIMQEYSATTEEITAAMDEQNVKIGEMVNIIKNIEKLSSDMTKLAQQK